MVVQAGGGKERIVAQKIRFRLGEQLKSARSSE
jgi:hypothetical protein